MEQKQSVKIHRVGTTTFGCMLLLFGAMFLVHIFVPELNYRIIFRCWPCILIFLGLEVLAGNHKVSAMAEKGQQIQFLYDKTAVLLTVLITFFAMAMAVADFWIQYAAVNGSHYIYF